MARVFSVLCALEILHERDGDCGRCVGAVWVLQSPRLARASPPAACPGCPAAPSRCVCRPWPPAVLLPANGGNCVRGKAGRLALAPKHRKEMPGWEHGLSPPRRNRTPQPAGGLLPVATAGSAELHMPPAHPQLPHRPFLAQSEGYVGPASIAQCIYLIFFPESHL